MENNENFSNIANSAKEPVGLDNEKKDVGLERFDMDKKSLENVEEEDYIYLKRLNDKLAPVKKRR